MYLSMYYITCYCTITILQFLYIYIANIVICWSTHIHNIKQILFVRYAILVLSLQAPGNCVKLLA